MTSTAHRLHNIGLPKSGEGRSYAIAQRLALNPDFPSSNTTLKEALKAFTATLRNSRLKVHSNLLSASICTKLNSRFDMDRIVSFSNAWSAWNHAELVDSVPDIPLDQALFEGKSPKAAAYHRGIARLATSQKPFLIAACRKLLKRPGLSLLDLGAGFGIQARLLIEEGIVQNAACVDFPFVMGAAPKTIPPVRRIGGDIRTMPTQELGTFNTLWLGNLLHHYSANTNCSLLTRYRSTLMPGSRIVIQEYLLDANDKYSLPAAILGVHFALTTDGGRTYTTSEITNILRHSLGDVVIEGRADGAISSILVYKVTIPRSR
jgi:SAM-dependent methyltransferase